MSSVDRIKEQMRTVPSDMENVLINIGTDITERDLSQLDVPHTKYDAVALVENIIVPKARNNDWIHICDKRKEPAIVFNASLVLNRPVTFDCLIRYLFRQHTVVVIAVEELLDVPWNGILYIDDSGRAE